MLENVVATNSCECIQNLLTEMQAISPIVAPIRVFVDIVAYHSVFACTLKFGISICIRWIQNILFNFTYKTGGVLKAILPSSSTKSMKQIILRM